MELTGWIIPASNQAPNSPAIKGPLGLAASMWEAERFSVLYFTIRPSPPVSRLSLVMSYFACLVVITVFRQYTQWVLTWQSTNLMLQISPTRARWRQPLNPPPAKYRSFEETLLTSGCGTKCCHHSINIQKIEEYWISKTNMRPADAENDAVSNSKVTSILSSSRLTLYCSPALFKL